MLGGEDVNDHGALAFSARTVVVLPPASAVPHVIVGHVGTGTYHGGATGVGTGNTGIVIGTKTACSIGGAKQLHVPGRS